MGEGNFNRIIKVENRGETEETPSWGHTVSGGARYLEVDGRGIDLDPPEHRSNPDCSPNLPSEEAVRSNPRGKFEEGE